MRDVVSGKVGGGLYRAVVVAVGTQSRSTAYVPADLQQQAVEANIPAIHSCDYREPTSYQNKTVLIVGLGNSASEIATEVSQVAARTLIAVRTTPWIVPLTLFGIPSDVLAGTPVGPHWLQMLFFNGLQRLYIGHPTSLGFANPPDHQLLDRLPVSDRGIVRALRTNQIQPRPNLTHISTAGATFEAAPQPQPVDAIIWATGYRRRYPFMPEGRRTGEELDPVLTLFDRSEVGLLYMPEIVVPAGGWPTCTLQAEVITQYLLADAGRSERCVELNRRRRVQYAWPDCKGKMFCAADKWHADPHIYHQLMKDVAQWLSEK